MLFLLRLLKLRIQPPPAKFTGLRLEEPADYAAGLPGVWRSLKHLEMDASVVSATRALLVLSDCSNCGGGGSYQPPPYDFGVVGLSSSRAFYVRNIGGAPQEKAASLGNSFAERGDVSFLRSSAMGNCPEKK